jgi:hypothetical protein
MRRREKFILSSVLLSFGLFATQYVPLEYRILGSLLFFLIAYLVSAWALFEDLEGIEWLTIIPFPAFYAVSVSLFYFLLPSNALSLIAILAVFGVGMYGIYLTANIYSVAKIRTIQLLRAGHAVDLLFKLVMMFLLANTLFSSHFPFWMNGGLIFVATIPLALTTLWSIELKKRLERHVLFGTIVTALLVGELALILSFMPGSIWTNSLYLVGMFYTCLGILTTKFSGRLFQNTIWEYTTFWVLMTVVYFVLLPWK